MESKSFLKGYLGDVSFYLLHRSVYFYLDTWRSVQKVSSHVTRKIETFTEEDTRYKKHCTQDKDAFVPFKVRTLGPHTVVPALSAADLCWLQPYTFHFLRWSACCRPSRMWDIFIRFSTIFEAFVPHCTHCIIPKSLLNHPNSSCGGMFKLDAKLDTDLLLYFLSYFECDIHMIHMLSQCIYCPFWLVQWGRHCSHMRILVHSPWLPGGIYVVQTILIILTMARLFPDRPHISLCIVIALPDKIQDIQSN